MRRVPPLAWFIYGFLSLLALGITFFVGLSAGGLDIPEACGLRGTFDRAYWDQHYWEAGQFFPLRAPCNANYDLVPFWVNPALVIFAVAAVVCFIGFVVGVLPPLGRKSAR